MTIMAGCTGVCLAVLLSNILITEAANPWPIANRGTALNDGSVITIPARLKFLDNWYSAITVSVNGVVSFGDVSAESGRAAKIGVNFAHDTMNCDSAHGPYIALGWTQSAIGDSGGLEYYLSQAGDADEILLRNDVRSIGVTKRIKQYFQNGLSVNYKNTTLAILINWKQIVPEGGDTNMRNTYQLILISDGCQTYIVMNYVAIGYTGTAGIPTSRLLAGVSGGQGGTNGDGTCLIFPNSGTAQIDTLATTSANVNDNDGWYVLRVDTQTVYNGATPIKPLLLCPDGCAETCSSTGCKCASLTNTYDCTTEMWPGWTGCWDAPGQTGPQICDDCTGDNNEPACSIPMCRTSATTNEGIKATTSTADATSTVLAESAKATTSDEGAKSIPAGESVTSATMNEGVRVTVGISNAPHKQRQWVLFTVTVLAFFECLIIW